MSRIEEIRAREKAATPGPWHLDPNFQCFIWGPKMEMIADNGQDEGGTLTRMRGVGANLPLAENGDFIAHARADIPYLLEVNEALVKALEEAECKCLCITHGYGCGLDEATCQRDISVKCQRCAAIKLARGGA